MTTTTDVATIIADADTYAKALLQDAGTAADSILSAAASSEPQALEKVEQDTFTTLLDFVPSAWRSEVSALASPIVNGVETNFNAAVNATVAKGLAVAKARIDALTGATG